MRPLTPPGPPTGSRIDLHLHTRASTDTASWFLNRAFMPESFTEPEAAYAAAKRRGMDLVTLTDTTRSRARSRSLTTPTS